MIPSFLISKAYKRGSLRNRGNGFEFSLRNPIETGTLIGVGPLVVDGTSCPAAAITIRGASGEIRADELTRRNPLEFAANSEMRVIVAGEPLPEGPHELVLTANTAEIGRITLNVKDDLSVD